MTELTVIWEGLVSGALYGLVGLAYLLMLRATRVYNFAVGSFASFAAVAYGHWSWNFPHAGAILVICAITAVGAIAVDTIVTRPIQNRETGGHLGVVLSLTAALFVVLQITRQLFSARTVLGFPLIDGTAKIFGTTIALHGLITILAALAATVAVEIWQRYGMRGRLLAAVGDNWEAAVTLGLPVTGVRAFAVGLGGAVCGLMGALYAGGAAVDFYSGFSFALTGFLALVIGGPKSNWGPLLGGCVIGLTETIGARIVGASIHQYLLLLVILVVFRLSPQGILAKTVRR